MVVLKFSQYAKNILEHKIDDCSNRIRVAVQNDGKVSQNKGLID